MPRYITPAPEEDDCQIVAVRGDPAYTGRPNDGYYEVAWLENDGDEWVHMFFSRYITRTI